MYVAFEGLIGAGKTTAATYFAQHLGLSTQLILEHYEDNPFLERFYEDATRWALPMQLTFLMERFDQAKAFVPTQANIVSDQCHLKDRLFASQLLTQDEFALYDRITTRLSIPIIKPDVVVYLDVEIDELLRRIAKRGRSYEMNIDDAYLERFRRAYSEIFSRESDLNVLWIDATMIDLHCELQRARLWEQVSSTARSNDTVGCGNVLPLMNQG